VEWKTYRYFDPKTVGLDFEGARRQRRQRGVLAPRSRPHPGLLADIKAAPEGSVIVLHGCAHNPTGIDPTLAQWALIADAVAQRNHVPFFDVAYQGFATGDLEADAAAPRLFAARGMEMFVAQVRLCVRLGPDVR